MDHYIVPQRLHGDTTAIFIVDETPRATVMERINFNS